MQGFAEDFHRLAVIASIVQLFTFGTELLHLRQYGRIAGWIALQQGVYFRHICRAVHGPQRGAEQCCGEESNKAVHGGAPL
ncbi:hypothetical protein D3C85_1515830 [compost metagenome]